MIFACEIPGNPGSANHDKGRNGKTGATYIRKSAAAYRRIAGLALVAHRVRVRWQSVKWCSISYEFFNLEADADNIIKIVQDCLQRAGVVDNDKYAVAGTWRKSWDEGEPRTHVTVTLVDPVEFGIPERIANRGEARRKRHVVDVAPRVSTRGLPSAASVARMAKSVPGMRPPTATRRES